MLPSPLLCTQTFQYFWAFLCILFLGTAMPLPLEDSLPTALHSSPSFMLHSITALYSNDHVSLSPTVLSFSTIPSIHVFLLMYQTQQKYIFQKWYVTTTPGLPLSVTLKSMWFHHPPVYVFFLHLHPYMLSSLRTLPVIRNDGLRNRAWAKEMDSVRCYQTDVCSKNSSITTGIILCPCPPTKKPVNIQLEK